jgi:hypothetical protein
MTDCGLCRHPLLEGQTVLCVPHIGAPDSQIHAVCPAKREGEG